MKMQKFVTHFALLIILGLISTTSYGCRNFPEPRGQENPVKEERNIANFTKLDIGGAFEVILSQGDQIKLVVEAEADELKDIKTEVNGSTLKIYTESTWNPRYHEMKIYLTFTELEEVGFSGAVEVTSAGTLSFTDLELNVSGATEIELSLTASKLDAEFSGASEIDLTGKATSGRFELSGASDFNAEDLEFQDLSVEVSGASDARVWATGTLNIDASGASTIRYKGNPRISLDESGASSVKPL